MTYKVIVSRPVSRKFGGLGLSRDVLLLALNRLYDQLENHGDKYRGRRAPGHEDDLFLFEALLSDQGHLHRFRFHVNDRIAPGVLFVEDFTIQSSSF